MVEMPFGSPASRTDVKTSILQDLRGSDELTIVGGWALEFLPSRPCSDWIRVGSCKLENNCFGCGALPYRVRTVLLPRELSGFGRDDVLL